VNREVSELLSGGALWHLKVAGCFPKMLHGFSRRKAASGRCRAGFESRGLLPEDAVRHLKVASFFPEMLRGLLTFRCPLSVFARCIKCGARVRRSCCFEEKIVLRKLLISLGDRLISSGRS